MRQLRCSYVPITLGYGYVDAIRQDRPYFVTEYVDGALDGEAWLVKFGKLDSQSEKHCLLQSNIFGLT